MTEELKVIPEEFTKVITDFVNDLKSSFVECEDVINSWWKNDVSDIQILFDFCKDKFPPRFFDILYKNESMFDETSDIDTEFLPNIHFKKLWNCNITDNTKITIWKYLQLIMFSIVGTLHNKEAFGDTAKLFETIDESDFKTKLEETLSQMQGLYSQMPNMNEGNEANEGVLPDADKIHEHISEMLDGKLGNLAREIAEETATDLNMDFDEGSDIKDVFQKLMKNPTKLMGLVKTVGDKLDSKLKSGDIKESELISEATEMMNKMKNMPGMENIQSLFGKMGMNMGGGKVNTSQMEANLNQKMKMAKLKEKIRAKSEANAKIKLEQQILQQKKQEETSNQKQYSEEELIKIFSSGEKIERTPRNNKNFNTNTNTSTNTNTNKKKKGKK
jgi:hypothetical protein